MGKAVGGIGKSIGGIVGSFTGGMMKDANKGIDAGVAAQAASSREASARLKPFADQGAVAMKDLYAMTQGGFDFKADPGYQFRLGQGERAIERATGTTAGGPGRYSGATLKALTQHGQNFASNEYNRAFGRQAGVLQAVSGMGANAAAGQAGHIAGVGEAMAAGEMAKVRGQADITGSIFGGIGAGVGAFLGSDARLKTDIRAIDAADAHDVLLQLQPVLWEWNAEAVHVGMSPGTRSGGVIAQDLRAIAPELVIEGADGYLRVDYGTLFAYLLADWQRQHGMQGVSKEAA